MFGRSETLVARVLRAAPLVLMPPFAFASLAAMGAIALLILLDQQVRR